MRPLVVASCLVALVCLAGLLASPRLLPAASAGGQEVTGRLLLDSVPEKADLVFHVSDLPALIAAIPPTTLGTTDAWEEALLAQIEEWAPPTVGGNRFRQAGRDLLRMAEGELLLLGMQLPTRDGPARAGLVAFRTRRSPETVKETLKQIEGSGIAHVYPGEPTTHVILGRKVLVWRGPHRSLWVYVDKGIVAASDHPLALGLLFRGLEKSVAAGRSGGGAQLMTARHGPAGTAVTAWATAEEEFLAPPLSSGATPDPAPWDARPAPSVVLPLRTEEDLRLFPCPVAEWVRQGVGLLRESGALPATLSWSRAEGAGRFALSADASTLDAAARESLLRSVRLVEDDVVAWEADGAFVISQPVPGIEDAGPRSERAPGGAVPGWWLHAMAERGARPPFRGLSQKVLRLVAGGTRRGGSESFVPWRRPDRSGVVRGPLWNGPATLLALRTCHDICHGLAPGKVVVERAPPPPEPTVPLPRPGGPGSREPK